MGLFDKFVNKKTVEGIILGAPVSGEIIDITEVSDPTFAEKILGDGIAIRPSEGKFYAPCDGTLESLYPTGHAYSISSEDGAELLVHIGINTVELKGKHYSVHAKQGQKVRKGDLLVEVDLDAVRGDGYDVVTPMIIMNSGDYSKMNKTSGEVRALDNALTLIK
ncbi:MAG: PTS glucose transporter subunit IIA [Clostridiales bacterium]|jgi:glucose-specific phosphotransferase system IIA component|nr:PTS glucose transporter subunit IIA [Clostridiales bacterium]